MSLAEGEKIAEANSFAAAAPELNLRLLFRQVLAYLPGSILPAFIGLASAAIFTRTFSASEYGQYSLVLSITALATTLSSQWIQQATNRYLPGATDITARQEVKRVISFGLLLIIMILGVVSLVLVLFRNAFPPEWQGFILPGALLVMTMSAFNPLGVVLQAEMRARVFSLYALANAMAKLFFSIFIVFVIVHSPSGMVWGVVFGTAVLLPMLWRRAGLPSPSLLLHSDAWAYCWRGLMRFTAYGFPMIGWFLSSTFLSVGDRYVIQWFRGSAEVGIYTANYNLIQAAVGLITAPVILAAHPFLMRAWSVGDRANTVRWLGTITEWIAMAGIMLVGATWLFSFDLAAWFLGTEFRTGYVIMPVVIAGVVAWQLGIYAHKPLEFTERTRLMFILCLSVAGLNLGLNIILVPIYGYPAAAYSTLISYVAYAIIVGIAGQRFVRWRVKLRSVGIAILLTITSVAGLTEVRHLVEQRWGYFPALTVTLAGYLVATALILKLTGLNFRKLFSSV